MRSEMWTAERLELLRSLWAEGQTAAAIADRLGSNISRSAVLGKIFRLRLKRAAKPQMLESQEHAPARRRAPPGRYKPRGKTLMELTNTSCRWPIGNPGAPNFHFCGAPGADLERGIAYCARHTRRAYCDAVIANQAPAWRRKSRLPLRLERPGQRTQRIAANTDRWR
jgi:GcrA cell cycle regulator